MKVTVKEIGPDGVERDPRDHDKDGKPVKVEKARKLDPALTPAAVEKLIRSKQRPA